MPRCSVRRHRRTADPGGVPTATRLGARPKPHVYACTHLSNTASLLLPVPNLTNLLAFAAGERLRRALDDVGLGDTVVTTRVVAGQAEAERTAFTGSPTVLIDGRDPFAEPGRTPGLTCRVYRTPDGLVGLPALDDLRQVLRAAAGPPVP